MQKLGSGVLSWYRHERISDRYGTVSLFASPSSEESLPLVHIAEGVHGRLIVIVQEIRESYATVGDRLCGVPPMIPKVDEVITLGEGTLFFDGDQVGLRPDDGREIQWLNMSALRLASWQTVDLYFEEIPTL